MNVNIKFKVEPSPTIGRDGVDLAVTRNCDQCPGKNDCHKVADSCLISADVVRHSATLYPDSIIKKTVELDKACENADVKIIVLDPKDVKAVFNYHGFTLAR